MSISLKILVALLVEKIPIKTRIWVGYNGDVARCRAGTQAWWRVQVYENTGTDNPAKESAKQ